MYFLVNSEQSFRQVLWVWTTIFFASTPCVDTPWRGTTATDGKITMAIDYRRLTQYQPLNSARGTANSHKAFTQAFLKRIPWRLGGTSTPQVGTSRFRNAIYLTFG